MPGTREIKTRIKSIGSMRKITRAMQLVSAAKMGKAQAATLKSRTYAALAWELITNLTEKTDSVVARSAADEAISSGDKKIAPPYAKASEDRSDALAMTKLSQTYPKAKKTGIILLTTNKGLVGSLNLNLAAKLKEIDNSHHPVPINRDTPPL